MRFPNMSDLDRDQRNVYVNAPSDGAILVVGPPGTGKTVMAFHRAHKLKGLGQDPKVIMFSSVLRDFSSERSGVAPGVPVSTMHGWTKAWWKKGGMGQLPMIGDSPFLFDWEAMMERVLDLKAGDQRIAKLDWGHLLIDEGQDFPETMYFALGKVMRHLGKLGVPLRLTVFADDNQRLQIDNNCSVASIANNLRITADTQRNYLLQRNYRNSREVAKFARYFQVGRASGAALPPDRAGEMPSVLFFANDRELADLVVRKAKMSPGKQVGILVHGTSSKVKRAFNQVQLRAKEAGIKVQYYLNKDKQNLPPLDFEAEGTITVLHEMSAKGLEFDLVFYAGLEGIDTSQTGGLNEKMAMYVMASRARGELVLCFNDIDLGEPPPPGLSLMPPPVRDLCRFDVATSGAPPLEPFLSKVSWREPPADSPYWEHDAS